MQHPEGQSEASNIDPKDQIRALQRGNFRRVGDSRYYESSYHKGSKTIVEVNENGDFTILRPFVESENGNLFPLKGLLRTQSPSSLTLLGANGEMYSVGGNTHPNMYFGTTQDEDKEIMTTQSLDVQLIFAGFKEVKGQGKEQRIFKKSFDGGLGKQEEIVVFLDKDNEGKDAITGIFKTENRNALSTHNIPGKTRIVSAIQKEGQYRFENGMMFVISNGIMEFTLGTNGYIEPKSQKLLKPELTAEELGVAPFGPKYDPTSGFIVGGENSTEFIKNLYQLLGHDIHSIEKKMREASYGNRADALLGEKEKLLDVLVTDNNLIKKVGLQHTDLAEPLKMAAAFSRKGYGGDFTYQGTKYKIEAMGIQGPLQDATYLGEDLNSSTEYRITNTANGQSLVMSSIQPALIERFGFYEGKQAKYRLEPAQIIRVFPQIIGKMQAREREVVKVILGIG